MSQLFDFPEICITEASAGSGKTYALALRYVQLLLKTAKDNPQSFKNILAITFTNKASFEMKTRVLQFLKKIALNRLNSQEKQAFLDPLGISAHEASTLSFSLMDSLIRHYHFFSIKTIDSFINTLLAGCAFKINLSARFKIQRNSQDYLQQSLDQWIALSQDDPKVRALLDDFVHQYLFLENRSGWFPKEDLMDTLTMLFGEYNTYQKSFIIFPADSRDLYLAKKEFLDIAKNIQALSDPSMNKKFTEGLAKFLEAHPVSFDLDDVSRYFSYEQFPANKGVEISKDLEQQWAKARECIKNLCLAESYGVFNPYVMIFQKVNEVFARLCAQDDILFLQELNKKASALIEEGISVSELYYRLAVRFHHYLIDEFQDTSDSQWKNLFLMIQEALSIQGSLFVVGDKKQAIYSFRGGESRLFDELPQQFPSAPLNRDFLLKNWRSRKAVVEFNNYLFSPKNIEDFFVRRQEHYSEKDKSGEEVYFNQENIQEIQKTFEHSKQEIREDMSGGFVQVHLIEGKRRQERQESVRQQLLKTIADVQKRYALKDIAVLTRTNGQVEEVTGWLLSQGIHAQSERSCDIKNHPLINEIVEFLRFLNAPVDNVNFARFLLGEIFPKASGLSQEQLRDFLFECRAKRRTHAQAYLYKQFQERYSQVWKDCLEDFFNQVGIYPIYELVVSIYAQFRLHEFHDAQGFLMHFLELIKRREESSCDLEGFIDYFDNLPTEERFVSVASQEAIKVMTLHKAKGLEFEVVIIPFLEMTVQTSKSSDKALAYVLDVDDEGLRMLRLKKTYGRFSEILKKRYEDEYKASLAIELNNVYVALTRAISELYVMVPQRSANSINPAGFLFQEASFSLGQKIAHKKEPESAVTLPVLATAVDRRWVAELTEELAQESSQQAKIRQQGVILHYCLSKIVRIEGKIEAVVAKVVDEARLKFGRLDEGFYTKQLSTFLVRSDVCPLFEISSDVGVLCEQEIVNRFGDTRRLDRVMVFKDKIWIVDFKTSRIEEQMHQSQMKEYQQLIGQLYPKLKVEGFLVYLHE